MKITKIPQFSLPSTRPSDYQTETRPHQTLDNRLLDHQTTGLLDYQTTKTTRLLDYWTTTRQQTRNNTDIEATFENWRQLKIRQKICENSHGRQKATAPAPIVLWSSHLHDQFQLSSGLRSTCQGHLDKENFKGLLTKNWTLL